MSRFGNPASAWWFFGTLTPAHATGFNVQEVDVEDWGRIEVYHDRLTVWSRPPGWVVDGPEAARELFSLVVGAYALISGVPLTWSLDGWVEATKADIEGAMLGTIVDRRGRTENPMKGENAIECRRMRAAAELAVAARALPGYRVAFRDIHSALELDQLTRSDDTFVFAHRALAGAARAVSNRVQGPVTAGDWTKLAEQLEISPEVMMERKKVLDEARGAAAHGDEDDPELRKARESRGDIVNDIRLMLARVVAADTRLPLDDALLADAPPLGL
jgi:hypothetical protein